MTGGAGEDGHEPDTEERLAKAWVGGVPPKLTGPVERHLTFRDRLRAHAADRDRYARTKRELATLSWTYIQEYADAKTDVVTDILERARHGRD